MGCGVSHPAELLAHNNFPLISPLGVDPPSFEANGRAEKPIYDFTAQKDSKKARAIQPIHPSNAPLVHEPVLSSRPPPFICCKRGSFKTQQPIFCVMAYHKQAGAVGSPQRPDFLSSADGSALARPAGLYASSGGGGPTGGYFAPRGSPTGPIAASLRTTEIPSERPRGGAAVQPTVATGPPRVSSCIPSGSAVNGLPRTGTNHRELTRPLRGGDRFLPEFPFTDKPSFLRRLLVFLIIACVSPSLLQEDPFPPLVQILDKQAAAEKSR
ncbi:hypothetical protein cyc_02839 [Cyclospora cayetanensis]|uniref:Uncharacterized protein n=1 Tax=Cyclospora cayetanensis TaxID=88456 RepID=A0A1D3CZH3_9EIME|nr:hypothetical protein cyc_02839 [Cyclospora cayetanensis]